MFFRVLSLNNAINLTCSLILGQFRKSRLLNPSKQNKTHLCMHQHLLMVMKETLKKALRQASLQGTNFEPIFTRCCYPHLYHRYIWLPSCSDPIPRSHLYNWLLQEQEGVHRWSPWPRRKEAGTPGDSRRSMTMFCACVLSWWCQATSGQLSLIIIL